MTTGGEASGVHVARDGHWGESEVPQVFRIITGIAFTLLLLPVCIVALTALNAGEYLTFPPQGLSLRWIKAFLSNQSFLSSYLLSFGLAFLTCMISTLVGTMAAIFMTRVDFHGRALLRAFFLSPLMLPGTVVGLALYIYYLGLGIGLSRSLGGLLLGHILVTTPFVIGTVSAALYNFDVSLEEAARSLGAGPLTAFFKVTFPIIRPGIVAGGIFAFIISFGQFDLSLFLSTPDLTPLPIQIYISLRYKFEPTAAAAGLFAVLLVVASTWLIGKITDLGRFAGLKFS